MAAPWELDPIVKPRAPWESDSVVAPVSQLSENHGVALSKNVASPDRSLQIGIQGAGRGVADLVGAPVDLLTGGINGTLGLINLLDANFAGDKVFDFSPIEQPVGGSDSIANLASGVASLFGAPPIDYEDMTDREQLGYNVNRYGTQAAVGSGGLVQQAAKRAPEIVAGTTRKVSDLFVQPYLNNPTRTAVGDVASGVGSGVAMTAAEDYAPDNPLVAGLAALGGGLAGSTAVELAQAAGRGAIDVARPVTFQNLDPVIPVDPMNNMPARTVDVDSAARMVQELTRDPMTGVSRAPAAAASIGERASEFRGQGLPVPTSGILSDNVGLHQAEGAARSRNAVPFIERDTTIRDAASERVASLRDPGADIGAVRGAAETARDARLAPPRQRVADAERLTGEVADARRAEGAPLTLAAGSDTRAAASQNLDNAIVRDTYIPARTQKNALYEAIDPDGTAMRDTAPLAAVVARIREAEAALPPSLQTRSPILADIEALIDPVTGQGRPIAFRDLETMRMKLSRAAREARTGQTPNYDLSEAYDALRAEIGREAGRMAAEGGEAGVRAQAAHTNYAENYAPRYRAGPGDEMSTFTRRIDQDPTRSTTPPSQTAGRFLKAPEKVASLLRVLEGSPSAAAGRQAVREYLISDYASSVLNADGTVNARRAAVWGADNAAVLAQFPHLRTEFDAMIQSGRSGEQAMDAAAGMLRDAIARAKLTEREVERSAIGTLLREDPRDVAKAIFQSRNYGAGGQLDEIARIVANDEVAKRGWRAAVAEVVTDMVTDTVSLDAGRAAPSEMFRVRMSAMERLFKDREDDLAKVFSPQEMSTLRQGHALLEPLRNAMQSASGAPSSPSKFEQVWRLAEAGLKAKFGVLKGGGYMRTLRIVASTLPDNTESVQRLIERAFFDPEIAQYLLTRQVRDLDHAASNAWLRNVMAADAASRESSEPSEQ